MPVTSPTFQDARGSGRLEYFRRRHQDSKVECAWPECGKRVTPQQKGDRSSLGLPRMCRSHAAIARRRHLTDAVVPNPYCPNSMPGALTCAAWRPHRHCECGLPINPDEDRTCRHDPLDRRGLQEIELSFPAKFDF